MSGWEAVLIGFLFLILLFVTRELFDYKDRKRQQRRTHNEWKNGTKVNGKPDDKAK